MLDNAVENVNQTLIRTFILLGLSNVFGLQIIFFWMFSMMYMITLSGNVLLILMVRLNRRLQTPMYFFLSNLSMIDTCFSSTVVPKILQNTISPDRSISFVGCATQMYFHLALGGTECLLLAVMAYDRYTAICNPLYYTSIMDRRLCVGLVTGCWILSFLNSFILTFLTFQLPYCKSNLISHFFCEMPPLFRLSCRDIWFNEVAEYISGAIVALGSFLLILLSYLCITITVLKIRTSKERQKVFSTCASHILVVSLYYGAIMLMHLHPRSASSSEQDRVVTILYTVVTPMLNPIIYSIRNKDIQEAIKKTMSNVIQKFSAMKFDQLTIENGVFRSSLP
ncbi:olfactory receptor 5AP2-like [Rhinoderma darwinii]|uniref:olfactory receptor 5AP2-like n=1 Tax=Rhinoderma darwinii TaxID=43563 RepID=UPI003F671272